MAKPPLKDDDDPLGLFKGVKEKNFCKMCDKEISPEYEYCYNCFRKKIGD